MFRCCDRITLGGGQNDTGLGVYPSSPCRSSPLSTTMSIRTSIRNVGNYSPNWHVVTYHNASFYHTHTRTQSAVHTHREAECRSEVNFIGFNFTAQALNHKNIKRKRPGRENVHKCPPCTSVSRRLVNRDTPSPTATAKCTLKLAAILSVFITRCYVSTTWKLF